MASTPVNKKYYHFFRVLLTLVFPSLHPVLGPRCFTGQVYAALTWQTNLTLQRWFTSQTVMQYTLFLTDEWYPASIDSFLTWEHANSVWYVFFYPLFWVEVGKSSSHLRPLRAFRCKLLEATMVSKGLNLHFHLNSSITMTYLDESLQLSSVHLSSFQFLMSCTQSHLSLMG